MSLTREKLSDNSLGVKAFRKSALLGVAILTRRRKMPNQSGAAIMAISGTVVLADHLPADAASPFLTGRQNDNVRDKT